MGRPTDDPKIDNLLVRLTAEEKRMLEYCCEKSGKSKTAIVVEGIRKVYEELTKK